MNNIIQEENQNVLPAVNARVRPTNNFSKPKKRQGKASRQRNEDAYRERKGKQELEAFRRGILEKFGMLSNDSDQQLSTAINNVQITPQARATPLTVSTRGVGFVTAISYERTCTTWSVEAISAIVTVYQVYRVHLWLVHLKVYLAQQIQSEPLTVENAFQRVIIPDEVREQLQTVTRVPSVFAMILDSVGKFSVDNKVFHMGYVHEESRDILMMPLLLSPATARAAVEFLSNGVNPDARLNFINHNPIPGARFNNQHLLENPDQIWPINAVDILASDIHCYKNWITRVENRLPKHFFANVAWDGNGTSSGLWSTELLPLKLTSVFHLGDAFQDAVSRNLRGQAARREVAIPPPRYIGFDLTSCRAAFWSKEKTPHLNTVLGVGSLVGETCGIMSRFELNCPETVTLSPTNIEYLLADAPR